MEMNKIIVIAAITIISVTALLTGCDDEICVGFEQEPRFLMYSDSLAVKVFATNLNDGDTIYIAPYTAESIPIDMNSNQMTYEIYAPDYKGSLILDYTLSAAECHYEDEFLLVFDELSVNTESSFINLYESYGYNRYRGQRMDSIDYLADYFTPYGYNEPCILKIVF